MMIAIQSRQRIHLRTLLLFVTARSSYAHVHSYIVHMQLNSRTGPYISTIKWIFSFFHLKFVSSSKNSNLCSSRDVWWLELVKGKLCWVRISDKRLTRKRNHVNILNILYVRTTFTWLTLIVTRSAKRQQIPSAEYIAYGDDNHNYNDICVQFSSVSRYACTFNSRHKKMKFVCESGVESIWPCDPIAERRSVLQRRKCADCGYFVIGIVANLTNANQLTHFPCDS